MKNLIDYQEVANVYLNKPYTSANIETVNFCKENAIVEVVKEATKGEVSVKAAKLIIDGNFIVGVLVRNSEIVNTPAGKYMDEITFNNLLNKF
jgi:hypothetical protein